MIPTTRDVYPYMCIVDFGMNVEFNISRAQHPYTLNLLYSCGLYSDVCAALGGVPYPVIVTIRDTGDYTNAILYSYCTTITGR